MCIVAAARVRKGAGVRPDELFPVDGTVTSGQTAADESTLTGEAMPITKEAGAQVFSGTLNLWGLVQVKVDRLAQQSALHKIITMIENAQHMRAPSQRFTDNFGTTYTLGVLGLVMVMFFVWWLGLGLPPFTVAMHWTWRSAHDPGHCWLRGQAGAMRFSTGSPARPALKRRAAPAPAPAPAPPARA